MLHRDTGTFEGELARHDVLGLLMELAANSRRGQRTDLVALSKMVGPQMLASTLPTDRLLDGINRAVDRGSLVFVLGWGTPGTTANSPAQAHSVEQIVARAMGGAGEIAFDGERYVVKSSASWRQLPDQFFEALRPDVARGVLARLSARPRWSKDQKAALEEVATNLADRTKPDSLETGLVLLRRGSFGVADFPKDEATAAVTPSRAVEQVEKVDPVMDGGMVELDTEEVDLPVESDPAEDENTDASEDDGADGNAEASDTGGESDPTSRRIRPSHQIRPTTRLVRPGSAVAK